MKAVLQRVKDAWITVDGGEKQYMNQGLVVLFGVGENDIPEDTITVAKKISELRIFEDEDGKMNISAIDKVKNAIVVPSGLVAIPHTPLSI